MLTFKYTINTISFITAISLFLNQSVYAETLEEAKQLHPNADFTIDASNKTFSYTYDENQNIRENQSNNIDNQSNFSNSSSDKTDYKTHQTIKSNNFDQQTEIVPEPIHPTFQNSDSTIHANSNNENKLVTHAYGKDEKGFIHSINVDLLYDELLLAEFNKKAKTTDGLPLAIGNGKIISNPNFSNKNNLYTLGQCTYYVFDKRAQDGNSISTLWGDAKNWASQAKAAGFRVDNQPQEGAIFQTPIGAWGHVAYVERVNIDGSVFLSEMNYIAPFIISTRTISASEAKNYNYIH